MNKTKRSIKEKRVAIKNISPNNCIGYGYVLDLKMKRDCIIATVCVAAGVVGFACYAKTQPKDNQAIENSIAEDIVEYKIKSNELPYYLNSVPEGYSVYEVIQTEDNVIVRYKNNEDKNSTQEYNMEYIKK